jgi:predicted nucleic acid-binding protein
LGLTVNEATQEAGKLKHIFNAAPDCPAIFTDGEQLVARHPVTGKQTHDAHLAAVIKADGLSHILTFNTDDFKLVTDITPALAQTIL